MAGAGAGVGARGGVYLEVEPGLLERNMRIMQEDPMEEELKNLFSSVPEPPCRVVKPSPGFCVKTYTKPDNKKMFVNICVTDAMPAPKDITKDELMQILNSEDASNYRVPMSLGAGRTENDKAGSPATVYDVAINTKFFQKVENDEMFQTFFLTVVFEGLQDKYQFEIDTENYVILKNKKCMGSLQTHRIQIRDVKTVEDHTKPPLVQELSGNEIPKKPVEKSRADSKGKGIKNFVFRLRKESQPVPQLIAEFIIPNQINLKDLRLAVGEDRVTLEYEGHDEAIDFFLPSSVDQDKVVARLNRNNQILSVIMPTSN